MTKSDMMTLKAITTARRNLAQRIARFLGQLDRDTRAPTVWECWCLENALVLLESASYPAGEDAMMRAEKPDVFGTADAIGRIATAPQIRPVLELRNRLSTILKAEI